MNPAEFCTVLGDINEKYVAQAHAPRRAGGRTPIRWLAAAACLCLALGVGFWAAKNLKTTPAPIITHYESDDFGSQYQFLPPAATFQPKSKTKIFVKLVSDLSFRNFSVHFQLLHVLLKTKPLSK